MDPRTMHLETLRVAIALAVHRLHHRQLRLGSPEAKFLWGAYAHCFFGGPQAVFHIQNGDSEKRG